MIVAIGNAFVEDNNGCMSKVWIASIFRVVLFTIPQQYMMNQKGQCQFPYPTKPYINKACKLLFCSRYYYCCIVWWIKIIKHTKDVWSTIISKLVLLMIIPMLIPRRIDFYFGMYTKIFNVRTFSFFLNMSIVRKYYTC